jgi:hypothetical protein
MTNYSEVCVSVDDWYEGASEGAREHMANKLAKSGYPSKGVHCAINVFERGYKAGHAIGNARPADIGHLTVNQLVVKMKKLDVTIDRVLQEWYR